MSLGEIFLTVQSGWIVFGPGTTGRAARRGNDTPCLATRLTQP